MTDEYGQMELLGLRLREAVADVFSVADVTYSVGLQRAVRLRGRLLVDSDQAYQKVSARFRRLGYTPLFRRHEGMDVILAMPGVLQTRPSRLWLNALLLALTVLSVLWTGAMYEGLNEIEALLHLWRGWPFALSLLSILGVHEMGHYLTARAYGVPATLPFFIPMPYNLLGTLGAFIQLKGPVRDKRALLSIGAAGPLAGLALAIPILVLGLILSPVEALPPVPPPGQMYFIEGNSLLYIFIKFLIFRRFLPGGGLDVMLHPVAFAGWAGLLVTALNLIPAGQLDGGHIAYALLGERAQWLSNAVLIGLLLLGLLVWPGWFLWVALISLLGRGHPEPLDAITPLEDWQKGIALMMLLIFVFIFIPRPMTVIMPPK